MKRTENFYGEKYIIGITPEWHEDGQMDFTIDIDIRMLLDKNFGFNVPQNLIDELNYKTDYSDDLYIRTDCGTFFCCVHESKKHKIYWTWLWALPVRPITTKSIHRKNIGDFYLSSQETDSIMPRNKYWYRFKKGLIPLINEAMIKELQEGGE